MKQLKSTTEIRKVNREDYEKVTDQIKEIFDKVSIDSFINFYRESPFDNILHTTAIFK